jgi:hypothetical protein
MIFRNCLVPSLSSFLVFVLKDMCKFHSAELMARVCCFFVKFCVMVFIVLHDVFLCWFQKCLGPLHIMSLLWHVMQVTKTKKVQSLFFLSVKPPFYFFIVGWIQSFLIQVHSFLLSVEPRSFHICVLSICWSSNLGPLLMVKHVGPFANHLYILVCWTRALLLIVFFLIVGQTLFTLWPFERIQAQAFAFAFIYVIFMKLRFMPLYPNGHVFYHAWKLRWNLFQGENLLRCTT